MQTERDKFDNRIYSVATVNENNRMGRGRRGLQTTKIPMAFFKKYQFLVELFPKCRYHFFFYIPNILQATRDKFFQDLTTDKIHVL